MKSEPQAEHAWLQKMVGRWNAEFEMFMGPDQPPQKSQGTDVVRSLGGLWVMAEGEGQSPEGDTVQSVMSLGYDPQQGKFVGTFMASVMTFLWIYEGQLEGDKLTLDCQGPDFSGGDKLIPYQDVIEFLSDDHRTLSSYMRGENGDWTQIVSAHYHRLS